MAKYRTEKYVLDLFHPLVAAWFRDNVGKPTDIQEKAWPRIVDGDHVLVTAPTGSGKTLTAFLWAINSLLINRESTSTHRVLYISPLKALNNDIKRNLEEPLNGLREYFSAAGEPFPEITTAVRSGDTDQSERRRMIRRPPEIFITTPESLNVLLTSKSGENILKGISTVILDEIHAVAETKRGTWLMTAVERLADRCGEFQRIALSATVKPLETAADFVGGYTVKESAGTYVYDKRRVEIIKSSAIKKYDISVNFPEQDADPGKEKEWWKSITTSLKEIIANNRSTLLFANSRRMVEKITRLININEETDRVYSHHGSLSKEIRSVVEKRLKDGELSAIVATGSLELGIDIGAVDQVALVQTPYSIASAIQRIGRAGHGVGQVSRGSFNPIHSRDFIQAAVLASLIGSEDIESLKPLEKPLDVLAQMILSMTLHDSRNLDELFGEILASWAYRELSRREFDLVIEMLADRYADSRIRELKPRLLVDRVNNTAAARDSVRTLIYLSGGVIPDRGYFNLRVQESKAKIGELDEEFVWERSLGDAFPFGNQIWQIMRITHNDVEVKRVDKSNTLIPFWKAEDMNRSFHLSEKIGLFLENADNNLTSDSFKSELMTKNRMDAFAADSLIDYLKKQKEAAGTLPHRHNLLVEHFRDPANVSDTKQTVLHTIWGGAVNRPLAFALSAAWEEKYGYALEIFANNDCIMLNLPHDFGAHEIIELVESDDIPRLLRSKLESTGYFGAKFRENAQRALLLPRRSFRDRMPLWMNRLRSKKLIDAVSKYDDFPILLETWRTCMNYDFDLDTLSSIMAELRSGEITVEEVITQKPSPFAENIIWRQTNHYMYLDDTPGSKLRTQLSDSLLEEVMNSSHLRPRLSAELLRGFTEKLQRTAQGYTPDSPEELLEWVRERKFIPSDEWSALLAAIERDHEIGADDITSPVEKLLYFVQRDGGNAGVIALENLSRFKGLPGLPEQETVSSTENISDSEQEIEGESPFYNFLAEWIRFYGPVTFEFIADTLAVDKALLSGTLEQLLDSRTVIIDEFRMPEEIPGGDPVPEEICDIVNLEILLRMRRNIERPSFEPMELERLPLFLASHQGLCPPGDSMDDLRESLEKLFGYPARAAQWEENIFPARLEPYYGSWLDSAMRESELLWFGCGKERLAFAFQEDIELFPGATETDNNEGTEKAIEDAETIAVALAQSSGRMNLSDVASATKLTLGTISGTLWDMSWQGSVTNDDFATIRKGIMSKFKAEKPQEINVKRRRSGFSRWKNTRSFTGSWFQLDRARGDDPDAIDIQEIKKDRIRQLFARYGVLFREILKRELPSLQWAGIFRTLRLMELSGEIFTGHFFKGIPGLQFCSHAAMRSLNAPMPEDAVYWMNATDPASLAGVGIDEIKGSLPPRMATTHMVFHGTKLVLVSRRHGGELTFTVPPDHPRILDYMAFFKALISREFRPLKHIQTETVNGENATESAYKQAMSDFGFKKEYKEMVLRKQYGG